MDRLRLSPLLCVLSILALNEFTRGRYGSGVAMAAELEGFGEDVEDEEFEGEEISVDLPVRSVFHTDIRTDPGRAPADVSGEESAEFEVEREEKKDVGRESEREGKNEEVSKKKLETSWDDDEFEGFPEEEEEDSTKDPLAAKVEASRKKGKRESFVRRPVVGKPFFTGPLKYIVEALAVVFLCVYGISFWLGRKENEKVALAWAEQFCTENGIFEKNFSLVGSGDGDEEPLMMKEGQNVFKFYASGRRFCEGLLATLDLQSRHDLISVLSYYVIPRKDLLTIQVYMNEESMDPFVLAVTKRKNVKAIQRENRDLKELGSLVDISSRRRFPVDELSIITDSREAAMEVLTDVIVDQLFGDKVFEKISDLFVSLHFSDQYPNGTHKKLLLFKFNLPPAKRMADLSRLMAAIPVFIDSVGRFKLSAAGRSKAESVRAKHQEEEEKEKHEQRMEAIQRKKEEKRRAEEARRAELESRLPPEVLAKRQEKERSKAAKRVAPKVKLTRVH